MHPHPRSRKTAGFPLQSHVAFSVRARRQRLPATKTLTLRLTLKGTLVESDRVQGEIDHVWFHTGHKR